MLANKWLEKNGEKQFEQCFGKKICEAIKGQVIQAGNIPNLDTNKAKSSSDEETKSIFEVIHSLCYSAKNGIISTYHLGGV